MADPAVSALVERLLSLARQAVNGWAANAKRKAEHDDIARLHREIDEVEAASRLSSEGGWSTLKIRRRLDDIEGELQTVQDHVKRVRLDMAAADSTPPASPAATTGATNLIQELRDGAEDGITNDGHGRCCDRCGVSEDICLKSECPTALMRRAADELSRLSAASPAAATGADTMPTQIEVAASMLQEVVDKSEPRKPGGQQVGTQRYQATPSTRQELKRIVRYMSEPDPRLSAAERPAPAATPARCEPQHGSCWLAVGHKGPHYGYKLTADDFAVNDPSAAERPAPTWQPIESAPDATYVIVWLPNYGWARAIKSTDAHGRQDWWAQIGQGEIVYPKFWQHEPARPGPVAE